MIINKNLPPILFLDDDEQVQSLFGATFKEDYQIHLATSGQQGLEIMEKQNIHLVITDLRMPHLSGIEFLEKIKILYPDCIQMVLSGYSDAEEIIEAVNKGSIYCYVTKPWKPEEFKTTIDRALEEYHLKLQYKKQIEQQQLSLTDSIHYARRMQTALLPSEEDLDSLFPSYFLLNKPKDIVSGDFCWLSFKDNKVVVAVADCSGHGVPGAFLSILGIAFLNEIIRTVQVLNANLILEKLRARLIKSLYRTRSKGESRDGMEVALCIIDYTNKKLQFSGAFSPLYFYNNNELNEIKGDYMPIGLHDDDQICFSNKEFDFSENDTIYIFSDGYVSQIGGPNRKTFRSRRFKQLLNEIHHKPLSEQKEILEREYQDWKKDVEQIDDIMVMGIRLASFTPVQI
jgi:sigma-B regulation protein RsbU (phosphoserine phosphatase)